MNRGTTSFCRKTTNCWSTKNVDRPHQILDPPQWLYPRLLHYCCQLSPAGLIHAGFNNITTTLRQPFCRWDSSSQRSANRSAWTKGSSPKWQEGKTISRIITAELPKIQSRFWWRFWAVSLFSFRPKIPNRPASQFARVHRSADHIRRSVEPRGEEPSPAHCIENTTLPPEKFWKLSVFDQNQRCLRWKVRILCGYFKLQLIL